MRYPADPPTIEEIVTVMRRAGDGIHGRRLRGLIVVLWRAGLRIHEALALAEAELDRRRGSLLVRRGKGGRRREVGMDDWAWEQLAPWLQARIELPVGPLFCAARSELRHVARKAGVRRCFAPHHLRHAHAVEMAREGVPLIVIQRQRAARMDRVDDLGVVDALEVDGGDAEVGVAAPMVPVDSSLPL
jgi:site-specific recombinase XerD